MIEPCWQVSKAHCANETRECENARTPDTNVTSTAFRVSPDSSDRYHTSEMLYRYCSMIFIFQNQSEWSIFTCMRMESMAMRSVFNLESPFHRATILSLIKVGPWICTWLSNHVRGNNISHRPLLIHQNTHQHANNRRI